MKSRQKFFITNKSMTIGARCPESTRSHYVKRQVNLNAAATNHDGSSLNCDLNPLQELFSPLECCCVRGIHKTQQDKSSEEKTISRLNTLNSSYSTYSIEENMRIKTEFELPEQLFCLLKPLIRTMVCFPCRLANSSSIRKTTITFYNIFVLIFFVHLFLISMATASAGVWW